MTRALQLPAMRLLPAVLSVSAALDARNTAALSARRQPELPRSCGEIQPDGSTTIYFSPVQPQGVERGNWIQTVPERVGSLCCDCIARWSPSLPRRGARVKSNW